jgi:hypothetical protein
MGVLVAIGAGVGVLAATGNGAALVPPLQPSPSDRFPIEVGKAAVATPGRSSDFTAYVHNPSQSTVTRVSASAVTAAGFSVPKLVHLAMEEKAIGAANRPAGTGRDDRAASRRAPQPRQKVHDPRVSGSSPGRNHAISALELVYRIGSVARWSSLAHGWFA